MIIHTIRTDGMNTKREGLEEALGLAEAALAGGATMQALCNAIRFQLQQISPPKKENNHG